MAQGEIETDIEAIEGMGGIKGTAEFFGLTENAIALWIHHGIPTHRRSEMREELRLRGFAVADCFMTRSLGEQGTDGWAIDALGGTVRVARFFGITVGAVAQWRESGIPAARRAALFFELRNRGYRLPESFLLGPSATAANP